MQTHRFIQIDDLSTGRTHITEMMAGDVAAIYSVEHQTLLAMGRTIRIGHLLHLDLQAFVRVNRVLPKAMTRPPAQPDQGDPQLAPLVSIATDDGTLNSIATGLPAAPIGPDDTILRVLAALSAPAVLPVFRSVRGVAA